MWERGVAATRTSVIETCQQARLDDNRTASGGTGREDAQEVASFTEQCSPFPRCPARSAFGRQSAGRCLQRNRLTSRSAPGGVTSSLRCSAALVSGGNGWQHWAKWARLLLAAMRILSWRRGPAVVHFWLERCSRAARATPRNSQGKTEKRERPKKMQTRLKSTSTRGRHSRPQKPEKRKGKGLNHTWKANFTEEASDRANSGFRLG